MENPQKNVILICHGYFRDINIYCSSTIAVDRDGSSTTSCQIALVFNRSYNRFSTTRRRKNNVVWWILFSQKTPVKVEIWRHWLRRCNRFRRKNVLSFCTKFVKSVDPIFKKGKTWKGDGRQHAETYNLQARGEGEFYISHT